MNNIQFTFKKFSLEMFKIPSLLALLFIICAVSSHSQISYTCDMNSSGCGATWDNNGFSETTGYGGGCTGGGSDYSQYDNVWNNGSSVTCEMWNSTAITGHSGGDLTITVKTKLRDYSSPYSDRSSSEWGTLKIYYKTTTPSASSLGTQIGSDITSSTDCQTHSVSFSPGTTISNLYLAFAYTMGSGDNYIHFDDLTITESNAAPTCDVPTISPSMPGVSDDITCSVSNVADANGDATTVAYDWRIGGNSYAKKYITFNSTSSSEVRDYSSYGSGENFSVLGSPTETTGISGNCYDFSATGQYIRNQSTTPIDLNGGVSVSIWSFSDNLTASPNYQQLFFLRDNSGGGGAQLVLREYGSGGMEAFVKTNGDLDWGPDYIYQAGLMTANTWYHWVLTYDGANTMLLYRNGVQIASTTTNESGLAIIDDICIGGSGTNNWFSGKLDEFRVYTNVLTPTQITALYNSGTPQDNILKADATNNGDVIDVYVTPNDGTDDGTTKNLASTVTVGPMISTSGTLSALTACAGSNSSEGSFSVSGGNLSANIVVTPPSGYEVSTTSGSSFGSSVSLSPSSGTVSATTIFVRTTTSASNGAGGNIACTSSGATTVNVATGSATINAAPSVNAGSDVSGTAGGSVALDATVSGNLTGTDIMTEAQSETANYGTSTSTLSDPNWSTSDIWKGESNNTTSSNTGPSAPQSGDDYIYLETSSGTSGYLTSGAISGSNINISFYYHMYGSTIGTLKLQSYDGSSWTDRWSLTGQQQSDETDAWLQATVDLSAYTVTQLRFYGSATGDYSGDIALDNINVSKDNAVYAWTTNASNGTSGWSATNTVDITVSNSATANHAGNYTLSVTDANGCQASDVVAVTVSTPTISSSGTLSTFTACSGVNSSNQTFSVSGSDLVANLVVTPPSGYEVSTSSGSGFGSSVSLSPSSGTVNSTTIYVRTSTGASNGDGGNIACTSTSASTVNVATGSATINSATANAGSDVAHCSGLSSSLSASGGSSYSWSPSTGLSATNVSNPTASHTSTTTYTVTVTDGNGCTATDNVVVTVNALPTTPNAGSDITVNLGQAIDMAATSNLSSTSIAETTPGQNSDDGYEYEEGYYEGRIYVTNAHLRTGDYGDGFSYAGDITLAIRFPNIAIPQGSIINSASLKMTAWDANTDDVEHKIYAHDVDDASTISTSHDHFSNEISGYTKTTAGVDWDLTGVASNTEYTSADISTVIQEIVDRGGWASGQDIKLIIADDQPISDSDQDYRWYGFDQGTASKRPKLNISYSNGTMAWTTNASAGVSGFANTTEDPQVTASADATHSGNYTLTVTDGNGCTASDVVAVNVQVPNISTSGSLSTFTACNGSNSAEQSFTISGTYLQSNLVVTPPSGYEVSTTSGSSFASSVNLPTSSGTVNSTTIYVRTTTGASDGDGGNIVCTSTNATTSNLATGSATVVAVPNAGTLSGNTAQNIGSQVQFTTNGNAGGTWSSDNTSAATVNSSTGVVTAAGIGNAVITYTKSASPCSDATATRTVNVTNIFLTTGSNSNWSNTACWGGGVVPPTSGDVTISHDITVDASTNTLGAVTIDNAKTLTVASGQTITASGTSDINGTLVIAGSGKYDANGSFDATSGNVTFTGAGTLELGGTVTSLGTFTGGGNSTVVYNGGAQIIDDFSSKSGPYETLTIAGSDDKELSGNTTVSDLLSWTADIDLETNGHTLTITQTPSGYSNSRVIVGGTSNTVSVAYQSASNALCFIPFGIDGSLRVLGIAPVSAETFTAVYTPGTPFNSGTLDWNSHPTGSPIESGGPVAHVNNHYYYDVSRAGSVNADLYMGFNGLTAPSSTGDMYMMHWNSSNNQWERLTTYVLRTASTVAATATQFSPFTQGSGGSALPIDLVSFTGACENNETELEFVVASQINNDYFSIYRSTNAIDWNLVGEIEGAGNTSTQLTYNWIDNNPLSGVSYYKLAQTDYDGASEMFSPIAVTCEAAAVDGYSVYPNPANEVLNIDLELENYQGDDVSIEVIDINGKIIQLQQVQLARGYNHVEVDLSEIPSGVYMINFVGTRDYIKESRIIKQ